MKKGYIEKCLWEYKENTALIERLKAVIANLMSVRGHSYEAHVAGVVTDPVLDVTHKILMLEQRIKRTEERVKPVEKLREDIAAGAHKDKYIREVLKLRYLEHSSVDAVREILHISSSTYGRAKQKLLRLASKYFGVSSE